MPGLDLEGIDIGAIARGYGCTVDRASTPAEVSDAFRTALGRTGPTVLIAPVVTDAQRLL